MSGFVFNRCGGSAGCVRRTGLAQTAKGDLFVFHDDSFGVIAPGALERALIMVPNLGFDTGQHHRHAAR
jgi:hypothetical protein